MLASVDRESDVQSRSGRRAQLNIFATSFQNGLISSERSHVMVSGRVVVPVLRWNDEWQGNHRRGSWNQVPGTGTNNPVMTQVTGDMCPPCVAD